MTMFQMASENDAAAMEYITGTLTSTQRGAMVIALVTAGPGAKLVPVYGNEHTIRSLIGAPSPLLEEIGPVRSLTDLGRDVARYLIHTGNFQVPVGARKAPPFLNPVAA